MKKRPSPFALAALIAIAAGFYYHGSTKGFVPSAVVYWDDPFRNASYTIDTNDLRHVSFEWTAPPLYIPLDARAKISAVHLRDADTPTVLDVADVSMFAFGAEAWMPDEATNYAYYVECDWQPPPSVVTNGVYHIRANKTNDRIVPIGLKLKFDDHEIGGNRK